MKLSSIIPGTKIRINNTKVKAEVVHQTGYGLTHIKLIDGRTNGVTKAYNGDVFECEAI